MNFISHIPSPRPIRINSHIWLNLSFFFIPECLINSWWCCSRHHSQLAIQKSGSLEFWFILLKIRHFSFVLSFWICCQSWVSLSCYPVHFWVVFILDPPKAIILEDSSFSAFSFHPQFFSIVVSSFVSRLSGALFKFSLRWLMISSFSCISINSWCSHSIVNSYRCFLNFTSSGAYLSVSSRSFQEE